MLPAESNLHEGQLLVATLTWVLLWHRDSGVGGSYLLQGGYQKILSQILLYCLRKLRPAGSVGRPSQVPLGPPGCSVGRVSIPVKPKCPPNLSPWVVDMLGISS